MLDMSFGGWLGVERFLLWTGDECCLQKLKVHPSEKPWE
jgi:hypothetical protein